MPIASGANLAKSYSGDTIFRDVTFQIQERERIALVGANGAGKSTLLRLLAGVEKPDAGNVALTSGARIGYLSQEVVFPPGVTLREYVLSAFRRLLDIESQLQQIQQQLASAGAGGHEIDALLHRHDLLLHEYENSGGYSYQNRMREVLAGLSIGEDRLDQRLTTFSGGQRTRVALAALLLSGQDLLLLDEPTNHLDLEATEWLETYLTQTPAAVVIVSHDRYFLDKVATRTWEMAFGSLEHYVGNYSQFAAQRAERHARLQKEFDAQQRFIARTQAFIDRYRAGQRSRQSRGRQKLLDRLERIDRPRQAGAMSLAIQSTLRSGEVVLATEDLVVAAGTPPAKKQHAQPGMPIVREAITSSVVNAEEMLFRCADLELRRGERAAIVGPNGSGKTTFLRVLTAELSPAAGRAYLGYGVQLAYQAQAHEQLVTKNTVLEEILSGKAMGEEEARTYLGRFLFTGDDVFKRVGSLSGGERSRLALAKLALGNANFLILDEPTNHLDIYSREALEHVLDQFTGTILFVSHDRYLIDGLATQIWEVQGGRLAVHPYGWTEYSEARQRERTAQEAERTRLRAAVEAPATAQQERQRSRGRAKLQSRLDGLEGEIATITADLHLLTSKLEAPGAGAEAKVIAELGRQHDEQSCRLAQLEEEWLAVHARLEDLENGEPLDATPAAGYRCP
jgi:ATP-binding cassette, subfamily F, member 3